MNPTLKTQNPNPKPRTQNPEPNPLSFGFFSISPPPPWDREWFARVLSTRLSGRTSAFTRGI